MPITISKAALSKSLREVRDAAREQGRAEGRAEAARMLEFAISLNGHGPATVKALRDGIDPAIRTSPDAATPEPEDDREPNPLDAATLAYIDALIEAKTHHAESDGGDVAAALRQMIDDPRALEAALSGDTIVKAMIGEKEKFGYLMADLPASLGDQLIELGKMIPDDELGEDGRETIPHVTVRYGFHDEVTPNQVASVVETWEEPLRVRLDHPECFYGKDTGKPYDVIVFAVDSEQLHYLHDALSDLPHTDTHPEYRPHATVAYVKAGLGDKWLKRMLLPTDAAGQEMRSAVIDSLVYSDAYRNKSTIPIGNPVVFKAFDSSKHPRGDDGRFIGREAIHAAKSDPALAEKLREKTTDPEERKKLDAALAGEADLGRTKAGLHRERVAASKQQKAERIGKVRKLAEEISMARRGGEDVPPEHFTELAAELPHLTVGQLRSVRESLAASFWGRRRRDEMVTALVRHAKVKAEQMRAEQDAGDPLDFSVDAMSGPSGGTGRGPEAARSDLNPWREFDQDKNFSEAQHGGRMYQRQQLMANLPESGKTSHGTPDTGSELKLGPKPEAKPEVALSETPPPPTVARSAGNGFNPQVGSPVAVLNGTVARGGTVVSVSPDGKTFKVRKNAFTPEQRARMEESGNPGLYDISVGSGFVFHPADMGKVNMWMSKHLHDLTGGADAGSQLHQNVVVRNDLGKNVTDPQMIRPAAQGSVPSGSAPIPSDVAKALSAQRTHLRRIKIGGPKEVGEMVAYRQPDGKVVAVPSDSYMGKELLAGKYPHFTIEGRYTFDDKGKPVMVKAVPSGSASDWDSLRAELLQDDAPPG